MAIKGVPPRKLTALEILVARRPIAPDRLDRAEAEAISSRRPIQTVVVEKGLITKAALLSLLKDEWKVEAAPLSGLEIDAEIVKIIPEAAARRSLALPFELKENTLSVAMANPNDLFVMEDIQTRTGLEVRPFLALPQDILEGLDAVYGKPGDPEYPEPPDRRGSGGMEIKYGLPDAPRKHLLVLESGAMELCDSEEAATSRINELGRSAVREVWEMRKRTIVDRPGT